MMFGAAILASTALGAFSYLDSSQRANAASNAQNSAMRQANSINAERLQMQKDALAKWESVFGSVEKSVGDYFDSLTPDRLSSLRLQKNKIEFTRARQQNAAMMQRRGLSGSNFEAYQKSMVNAVEAESRANIRSQSVDDVHNKRMQFLNMGLQQKAALMQGMQNAYGQSANTYSQQANAYAAQSAQYNQQANSLIGDALRTGGYIAGQHYSGVDPLGGQFLENRPNPALRQNNWQQNDWRQYYTPPKYPTLP